MFTSDIIFSLVPIFCGCILPIVIIWLTVREKMNANSRLLTATVLSLLITLGLFSIVSNVRDIRSMRTRSLELAAENPRF